MICSYWSSVAYYKRFELRMAKVFSYLFPVILAVVYFFKLNDLNRTFLQLYVFIFPFCSQRYQIKSKDKSSSHQGCSVKKGVLKISKKLLKKRLQHMCFPVNFVKFLRTPFLHRTPFVAASVLPYYSKTHCKNVIIIYYYKSLFQS